jgi:hypothetical protein
MGPGAGLADAEGEGSSATPRGTGAAHLRGQKQGGNRHTRFNANRRTTPLPTDTHGRPVGGHRGHGAPVHPAHQTALLRMLRMGRHWRPRPWADPPARCFTYSTTLLGEAEGDGAAWGVADSAAAARTPPRMCLLLPSMGPPAPPPLAFTPLVGRGRSRGGPRRPPGGCRGAARERHHR